MVHRLWTLAYVRNWPSTRRKNVIISEAHRSVYIIDRTRLGSDQKSYNWKLDRFGYYLHCMIKESEEDVYRSTPSHPQSNSSRTRQPVQTCTLYQYYAFPVRSWLHFLASTPSNKLAHLLTNTVNGLINRIIESQYRGGQKIDLTDSDCIRQVRLLTRKSSNPLWWDEQIDKFESASATII